MKRIIWLAFALTLIACRPQPPANNITIFDGEEQRRLSSALRTPAEILSAAEITLAPADRIFVNGVATDANTALDCQICTLQIRRAVTLTLITPDGEQSIRTAAQTVGAALNEMGVQLYAADFVEPPAWTPVSAKMEIIYRPAREFAVRADGEIIRIRSAAETVGAALAEAGIPLVGLDASQPPASAPLPADGQIRIVRVVEAIELTQTALPFSLEYVASNDVEIDRQEVLQPGEPGLAVRRSLVRYEDGVEVARTVEEERTVREPVNQIVAYGTQYVIRSANIGGTTIEYWRAMQVYATSYSPCRSAADRCYYSTSSGKPVQQGVIAVLRDWYLAMKGQPVYVEGYGFASIEDVGGGIPGKNWIDLGYSDEDYQPWHQWVTIYFLTPAPANTIWVLE